MCAVKSTIPDNISEEYYQISPDILVSFPKYRPPVDFFQFKETIASLEPYSRKGNRLSNQQVEELATLCDDGRLFVARSDHPIYSEHICKQLDLVLVDANLREKEITNIFVKAFQLRLEAFFDQAVQVVFDALYQDIMVLTEYLSKDWPRIKPLMRRLIPQHTLVNHSVNTGIVGLWLYLSWRKDEVRRRDLDRMALSAFLHDMGMTKIPNFILTKSVPLTQDERNKINGHPAAGLKLAEKLGLAFDEMKQAVGEHHERLDGSGYPRRIGDDIMSTTGKLMAVADSFCAMISERPYAEAMEPKAAAQALLDDSKRYDQRFTKVLHAAYLMDKF